MEALAHLDFRTNTTKTLAQAKRELKKLFRKEV